MKYLLDASALLPLITSCGKRLISEASKQNLFTIDLAIYEACNSLWKLSTLLNTITIKVATNIAAAIKDITSYEIIQPISHTELDLADTLKMAHRQNLTFYDASYIITAKSLEATFVTDDEKLRKIADKHVKTMTYVEFERKLTTN